MPDSRIGKEASIVYEFNVLWSGKYFQYWENEPHSHSYYQIIAVVKSGGRITLGEETVEMQVKSSSSSPT